MEELIECCKCCGSCFKLDIDMSQITHLKFDCQDSYLTATFIQDGQTQYMYSYDCGATWEGPHGVMGKISGEIKSVQSLLFKGKFVIAVTVVENGKAILKSCSGSLGKDTKEFFVKECEGTPLKGALVDVGLCVREKLDGSGLETVDIKYTIDNGEICLVCCGHG
jgi:hypothetical protein